jgi:serine/threonine protein kinase
MKLGEGGVGNVYLGEAHGSGDFRKLVVLKSLKPEMLREPGMRDSFLAEARLCARLNHPNIVQVLSVADDDGIPVMTMEYLEGQTLAKLLRDDSGACPLVLKLHAVAEALAGLAYFHELEDLDGTPLRPVHRDVSPQNVFVTYEGMVKLLDFGIAKQSARGSDSSRDETEMGIIKGKVQYMPREQILDESIDARVDLYASGAMLWEAVARRRMWEGRSDGQIISRVLAGERPGLPDDGDTAGAVPASLRSLIDKALATDRDERFRTASEMRTALMAVIDGLDPSPQAERLRSHMQGRYAEERTNVLRRIREARQSPRQDITRHSLRASPTADEEATAELVGPVLATVRSSRRSLRGRRLLPIAGTLTLAGAAVSAVVIASWRPSHKPVAAPVAAVAASAEPPAAPCTGSAWADFEDGWAHLCGAPGRAGSVILYSDGTGSLNRPVGLFGASDVLAEPRGESRRALHWVGKDLTDWGAGMVVALDRGKPVDLSSSKGISVWMRAEKHPVTVLVEAATTETLDVTYGGSCRPTPEAICDDHYAATRTISVFWMLVRVPFDQLRQMGFGVRADWNASHVLEVHIAVKKDDLAPEQRGRPIDFDLWVDDISVY